MTFLTLSVHPRKCLGFRKIKDWAAKVKKEGISPACLYLVGNKIDLLDVDPNLRRVTREEGEAMAQQIGAEFVQISVRKDNQLAFMEDAFEKVLNQRA